jgi:hypothetical protein
VLARRILHVGQILVLGLWVAAGVYPALGQGFETAIEPQGRVIPTIGPGVTALKQDSSGRIYVLAKPANVISIYGPDGKLVGQIPNAQSQGATLRYAIDFDLSPEGNVVVADRGANAVDVFAPSGSLLARVPVVAPTSVVALSGNQFAVTSLTSKRLVQVRDDHGNYVRSFGDPTEVTDGSAPKALADLGRISGDSAGHIYFAFTTVSDPTLREYDRYGYVGYEATVPEQAFETSSSAANDRVQVGLNVGRFSLSDQTSAWINLGSSGDVKFGGGVGSGLIGELGRGGGGFGGGFHRGGMRGGDTGLMPPGFSSFPGGFGGGPLAGTFSGQVSSQGTSFQLGMGGMPSGGGRGRGANTNSGADQSLPQGVSLSFFGSGYPGGPDAHDADFSETFNPGPQDFANNNSAQSILFADGGFGTPSDANGVPAGNDAFNQGLGVGSAFILGTTFGTFGERPPGAGGRFGAGPPGGAAAVAAAKGAAAGPPAGGHSGLNGVGSGSASGAHAMDAGIPHYGGHGHFDAGETTLTATVRVNLGDLGGYKADKPIITAVAVDPVTHDVWAGIGDSLVHFSKTGEPLEMFSLTLNGGTHLKPAAILIQPDRFLIATDPWGIFAFARPDGPASSPSMNISASPAGANPQL